MRFIEGEREKGKGERLKAKGERRKAKGEREFPISPLPTPTFLGKP
jgi:hypothetical protein